MTPSALITTPSCDDDFDPDALTCAEARQRIAAQVRPIVDVETVNLRAALGRVLGASVTAPFNVPGHTNSAMDGYAIRATDVPSTGIRTLTVIGKSLAGRPFLTPLPEGSAVRIMTGAVVPIDADIIVPQEQVERQGDTIAIDGRHRRGQHVRAAGEDFRAGQIILEAGHLMTPAELGLLASLGLGEVTVLRRPRVAFFSTGDELCALGQVLSAGGVYDSNRYTLWGMLTRLGVEILDLGVVADDQAALADAFARARRIADMVITSGGVSVGEADYTKDILAELGQVRFWKVAMKPGRPLAFGDLGSALFFGLPGNPVSVMVTFYQFVQPALLQLMGATARLPVTVKAKTTRILKKRPGRVEFQRAWLARDTSGDYIVTPTGDQGSGILSSMVNANCFILLDMDTGQVDAETLVDVEPFFGIM